MTTTLRLQPEEHPGLHLEVLQPEDTPSGDPWPEAETFVIRHLVADVTLDPLRLVATAVLAAAEADCVLVLRTPRDDDDLETVVALGGRTQDVAVHLLTDATLAQHVCRTGEPLRFRDTVGSILLCPLPRADGHTVLAVVRFPGRSAFTLADLVSSAGFGRLAGALTELSAAHADQHRSDTAALRERIAADLQGEISRQLFTVGLDLYSVAAGLGAGPLADRVAAATIDLDKVIAQIRATAFDLGRPKPVLRASLHADVIALAAELTPALGFEPTLLLSGQSRDSAPSAGTSNDVLGVLRKILSDIARHAQAGAVTVSLDIGAERLALEVLDDSGREPSGTRVVWSISAS